MFSFKSLIVEIIFPPGKAVAFSVRSRVLFAILQHSFVGVRWPHHHCYKADGAVIVGTLGNFFHHLGVARPKRQVVRVLPETLCRE